MRVNDSKKLKRLVTCRYVSAVFIVMLICMAILSYEMESRQKYHAGKTEDTSVEEVADATELSVNPFDEQASWKAVLYDNTSGLPTSEANAIVETSEGFIWIGSYAGLIRYDGNTFERMDSSGGLASVICLFVDSQDRLWVGTNANGVAVMENGDFHFFGTKEGLNSASVRAITEDADGYIYVATTAGIVTIDEDNQVSALTDERIGNAYIRDLCNGADGQIYGLTQDGDVFTMKDGAVLTFLTSEELGVPDIMAILPDEDNTGFVYLGTGDSIIYHGDLTNQFETVETSDVSPLSNIERLRNISGEIWLCAGNGIGCLDDSGFHLLENTPMDNSVNQVMMDYVGNLWFTSSRQGVMKIVSNQFTDIYNLYNLEPEVVNTTCMYNDALFIGTDDGITVLANGQKLDSLPLTGATTASGEAIQTTDLISYLNGVRIRSII